MANYTAQFRSNYFWVKDDKAFLAWVASLPGIEALRHDPSREVTPFALFADDGIPSFDTNDQEVHFSTDLAPHLVEDQVAILIEIGNEKLRYLIGHATAVHSSGRSIAISLNDIYREANEAFGVDASRAEY